MCMDYNEALNDMLARRKKVRKKQRTCICDGWWFPHRYGCKGCNFRAEFILDRSINGDGRYLRWHRVDKDDDIFGD